MHRRIIPEERERDKDECVCVHRHLQCDRGHKKDCKQVRLDFTRSLDL